MFVTFEGPEGAGKSTQARLLAETLRTRGRRARLVHEPGATTLGEQIRALLLSPGREPPMTARAEALLFGAARAQLVEEVIRPALARGDVVICDRFSDSSLAYQSGARGLPLGKIRALVDFATDGVQPDLTFLLDLEVSEGLRRKDGTPADRLEQEALTFHQKVRASYLEFAGTEPNRIQILDARRERAELAATIIDVFDRRSAAAAPSASDPR